MTEAEREQLRRDERDLAGAIIHHWPAREIRVSSDCFSDQNAGAAVKAAEEIAGKGNRVEAQTVLQQLTDSGAMEKTANGHGDFSAFLIGNPNAELSAAMIAADGLRERVQTAAHRRALSATINKALKSLDAGADPAEVCSDLQSHHAPSLGSFGSLDLRPFAESEPFPTEAFPTLPAEFIGEIARVAMVPVSMAAASVIGVLSAAIGAGLRVRNYKGTTGANIFLLCVAASGTGKDSALNVAAKPLFELERERLDEWELETHPNLLADLRRVKSRLATFDKQKPGTTEEEADNLEKVRELERERAAIEKRLEAEPALVVGDTTKEALGVALAAQPGETTAAISAEARGILQVIQGRYSNASDEDIFCGAFSGTPVKVSRIGRPTVRLKAPCLQITWMIQPDAFRRMVANPDMVESGLLPRFLFFDSRAEAEEVPEEVPEFDAVLMERWNLLIKTLVETFRDAETPEIVEPTAEAKELLRGFDNEIRQRRSPGGDLSDVISFAARWPEIAWRVALVLHAAHHIKGAHSAELDAKTAADAVAIVRWFAGEALNLLEASREERRRERKRGLRELLTGADGRQMTLRDLQKSHGFDAQEIKTLAERERWLEIRMVQNPRGGPRSPVAFLKGERP